jgi:erythronate-4-phosphate dehydrogenase
MEIWIDEQIPLLEEALRHNEAGGWRFRRFAGRSLKGENLQDCFALCVRSTTLVDAALLRGSPVRFVGTATSGSEHCDVRYLASAGIRFADAKGCNANAVAEYVVFATLLWAERRGDLTGETMGVVGYGNIGRRVAAFARALGMNVVAYDPPLFRQHREIVGTLPSGVRIAESLEEVCAVSSVLTNHVPLTRAGEQDATLGLLNATTLRAFGAGGLFVHVSRGGVADEAAVVEGIEKRRWRAAVDVWQGEPSVNADFAERCFLATPHIAGYTLEGKIRGSIALAKALEGSGEAGRTEALSVRWEIFEAAMKPEDTETVNWNDRSRLLARLRASRALEKDTKAFLHSLRRAEATKESAAKEFDRLRATYPLRREILPEFA